MKHLFWSLLKLNAIGIALLTFVGFLIGNSGRGREPGAAVFVLFLCCIVYLAYLNIRTVYRARQEVAASIQNSAVNVAASAIEFRNAAHARVSERIKERKQKTAWDDLNENPIFQEQKALFEAMSLMCEDGVDADEMPNGRAEFGMTPSNPIPCKTVFGSTAYLGRLRTPDGTKVVYERAGSVGSDVSPHPVDAYEISHPNGEKLVTLFISPYQKRISGKAPKGFKLADI